MAPPGKWLTGLCDCFAEGCCGVCCAVCWCSHITTGQLYQRTTSAGLVNAVKGANCLSITVALFILTGINIMLWSVAEASYETKEYGYKTRSATMETLAGVAQIFGFFSSLITCLVVCTVRKAIRKRDGIAAANCGEDCEDCCCASFCNPCTQCQIFRQEKIDCAKYQICSETATAVDVEGSKYKPGAAATVTSSA